MNDKNIETSGAMEAPAAPARRAPGANRLIAAPIAMVARHFPADRRRRSTHLLGYRPKTSTDTHLLLNEIPLESVNVLESLSHQNTHYRAGCCTSNLRLPPQSCIGVFTKHE